MLWGIDVSNWQNGINLSAVPSDIVVMKASEGINLVDGSVSGFASQTNGKLRAFYHFARPEYGNSAADEAALFVRVIRPYLDGQSFAFLDWEPGGNQAGNTAWAHEFLTTAEKLLGFRPGIYMNASTERSYDWSSCLDYGLWIAGYPLPTPTTYGDADPWPITPTHWEVVMGHQYSDHGHLNGYGGDLDLSCWFLDADAWRAYCATSPDGTPHPDATPTPPPAAPSAPSEPVYTVVPGDTLSGIAARFGSSVGAIAATNGIGNPNLIFAGQRLMIPGGSDVPASSPHQTYTVESGDTLSGIAAKFGTTFQKIAADNGIANPDVIYPGQVLTIA